MGRGSGQTFFQRRHTDGKQAHEKMLNITNHQGNANQNHNEISHTCQNGCYQNDSKQMLARMWRKGNPLHCWWECKLVQPLWKTVRRVLKKLKIELYFGIQSSSSTPGYLSEENENTNLKRYMHVYVHCNIIYSGEDMEAT